MGGPRDFNLVAKVDLPPEAVLARKPPGFKAPELRPTTLEKSSCFTLVTIVEKTNPTRCTIRADPFSGPGPAPQVEEAQLASVHRRDSAQCRS